MPYMDPMGLTMISSGQLIATFPAGWSPQKVVKSNGSYPKWPNIQVKDFYL